MITTLDRYLIRETLHMLMGLTLVVTVILLSISFMKLLQLVTHGTINPNVVMELVGLEVIRLLGRILPPIFFVALIVVLGRMYRDSEMVALAACGVGPAEIYRSFFWVALPLALATGLLSMVVEPLAGARIDAVKEEQKGNIAELMGITAGQFNEYSKGDLVFYLESAEENGRMHKIFIQHRQHGKLALLSAHQGWHAVDPQTGDHLLNLEQGFRYEGTPGQANYTVGSFERFTYRLMQGDRAQLRKRRRGLSTTVLWASPDVADQALVQGRLFYPFAVFSLGFLAIPLSRSDPRRGLYQRLFIAFLVYFFFLNIQSLALRWLEDGVIPLWLGVWWVHGLFAIAALILLGLDRYALHMKAWMGRFTGGFSGIERAGHPG